jgi:hypothetical protein
MYAQPIEMSITHSVVGSSTSPDVFGSAMWFTLHNGVLSYPQNPTEFVREGMKQLLTNLPLLVPCLNCKEHFYTFIKTSNLMDAVSSREKLFKFIVDIHNYVNRRYGKRVYTLDEAKRFYGFNDPMKGSSVRITYS